MTNYYTDDTAVAHELRSTDLFSPSTIPSLEDVSEWIGQASDYIDGLANKSFIATDYEQYFDFDGTTQLYLKNTPVNTITSLEYNTALEGETPAWVTKTEGVHFLTYPDKGYVEIVTRKWTTIKSAFRNIRINYNAGYATVPGRIKLLATKLVASKVLGTLLNNNISERNDGGSISVGDISIVEPGAYGVNSYKNLQQDIKDMEDALVNGYRVYRYG